MEKIIKSALLAFNLATNWVIASPLSYGMGFDRPNGYNEALTEPGQAISLDEFMAARTSLTRQNKYLGDELKSGPVAFKNLSCSQELKATSAPIKINLIYELHGTENAKKTAKAVIRSACQGESLLLLESDLSNGVYGVNRTVKLSIPSCNPNNVHGLDADSQLRSLWTLESLYQDSLSQAKKKPAIYLVHEAFMEEILRNSFLKKALVEFGASTDGGARASLIAKKLIFSIDQFSSRANGFQMEMSDTWVDKSISSEDLRDFLRDAKEFLFNGYVASHPEVRDYLQKKFDNEYRFVSQISPKLLLKFKGSDLVEIRTSSNAVWDDSVVQDAAFNRRDAVFVDEIGKSICEALKKNIGTINVKIGAGHLDGVEDRLRYAISKAGVSQNISIQSFSAEEGAPTRTDRPAANSSSTR